MKTKIYILVLVFLAIMGFLNAQTEAIKTNTLLSKTDLSFWSAYADKLHLSVAEKKEFLSSHQLTNIAPPQRLQLQAPKQPQQHSILQRGSQNSLMAGCINIDFENGNLNNWVTSCGFHPGYAANPQGCCMNTGGQQTIMTGNGLDPAGNFPVVFPGGNFSLRLGNNQTNGQADRVEQTFMVTPANANFTYRYAVVLQDPGHTPAQQPSFEIEMMDSNGVQIPCTYYNVSAGANIPGFFNSPNQADVVYKPWSSVVCDLTGLIGQNVTIRFTTYDCSLGGHFGYAYIDGSCLAFMTTRNDTICAGAVKNYCAPVGFLSTTWNGPGIVNNTSQCINASAPGVYTCQTVLIPGCPGPDFTYTLSNFPVPNAAFNPVSANACTLPYNFTNTSTISAGNISSYSWLIGNAASNQVNPAYTFPGAGNYLVRLIATSDKGCSDTTRQGLSIYPAPMINFSAPSGCLNSNVQFTNVSTVPGGGSITSYTWNLGNGSFSNAQAPLVTYTSSGNYVVSLSLTSNRNCVATQSTALVIYPKPTASFNSNSQNACAPQYSFGNTSSISSGSIASYTWNFGNGTSSQQNPVYSFPAAGNYTVSMIATSNQGCKDTSYKSLAIYPFPVVGFTAPSTCLNKAVVFLNTSSISLGAIASYTWSFGNNATSNILNPSLNYLNSGAYVVTLSATSNQNCVSTATGNLVIYPVPSASLAASSLCHGSSTSFSGNSSISSGSLVAFAWNFGDGNTSNAANPNHTYANTGNYAVSYTVTSSQGCISGSASDVTIHPLPVISYNVANVCHGNTTLFSNNSSIATGSISSYTWNFGNNTGSGLTNPSLVYLNSGSYVVTLLATSNNNCVATTTSNVVIHPLPVLSFSATNVCFGDNTQFSTSNSISSGSVASFNWNFGDGSISSGTTAAHTYNNFGSYSVSLSATSNQNCTATYVNSLAIHPLPVVSFSASNVCLGLTTSFINGSTIPSGSIASWAWNFGNSQPVNTQQSPSLIYQAEGPYTVSLTATSNKSCKSSYTRMVIVHPNPVASFTSKNACFGETSFFTNTSGVNAPDQIVSYSWDFGNGSTSNLVNPSITYATGAIYPVKLTVTTNNSCSRFSLVPVTIYHLPQVNFSPSSACKNQATQFVNASSVISGTMAKCRWDFESDGVWDDTVNVNPIRTYPIHGIYHCRLEVESSFQCKASKTNSVVVYANPVADFSSKAVCLGDVTTFSSQSTSEEGAITSYHWDFNGDNVTDNVLPNPSITYSSSGTYLIKLEVQTKYGCVNVKSRSGYINAKPIPGFVSKNNKGCPELAVKFENTSHINTGSIVTTQWIFGDGSLPEYSQSPTHMYAQGNYDVTLKLVSDSGCISTLQHPGFVQVFPKPVAGFAVNPEEIDENEPIMNIRSTAEGASFTRYYVNDGASFGTENFSHTFKSIDKVKPMVVQIVTNEYNCTDTLQQLLTVKPSFVIYFPNTFTPNGDGVNDDFFAKGVGINKFNMQIFDRWGHLLYEGNGMDEAWNGTVRGSSDPIKQDVYVWKARVVDIFNKSHDMTGHVSLIR
jgi:gliding motility-associated-like protein